jgi:redox-sensing transcriptional repressor
MSLERADSQAKRIPEATVVRLPVYQRILSELLRIGATTVSSEQLAQLACINAAKVRKDLSLLGSFGTRGTGYDTAFLVSQINRALGEDRDWPVIIVGVGNLGRALVNSEGFHSHGFRVMALFDIDPGVVGQPVGPVIVRHTNTLAAQDYQNTGTIGVITVPAQAAQDVADAMVTIGVRSILNFSPTVLNVPTEVMLRYVDLSIELQVMSFYQSRQTNGQEDVSVLRSVGRSSTDPD